MYGQVVPHHGKQIVMMNLLVILVLNLALTIVLQNVIHYLTIFHIYMEAINDKNDISNNNYKIYFYYQDLKYTLISEQPKVELFGFISKLGGILGLFIGFSFISLLDLF